MIGPACWLKLFGCFSLLVDDGTISLHLEHGSVPRQFFAIDFEHFFWGSTSGWHCAHPWSSRCCLRWRRFFPWRFLPSNLKNSNWYHQMSTLCTQWALVFIQVNLRNNIIDELRCGTPPADPCCSRQSCMHLRTTSMGGAWPFPDRLEGLETQPSLATTSGKTTAGQEWTDYQCLESNGENDCHPLKFWNDNLNWLACWSWNGQLAGVEMASLLVLQICSSNGEAPRLIKCLFAWPDCWLIINVRCQLAWLKLTLDCRKISQAKRRPLSRASFVSMGMMRPPPPSVTAKTIQASKMGQWTRAKEKPAPCPMMVQKRLLHRMPLELLKAKYNYLRNNSAAWMLLLFTDWGLILFDRRFSNYFRFFSASTQKWLSSIDLEEAMRKIIRRRSGLPSTSDWNWRKSNWAQEAAHWHSLWASPVAMHVKKGPLASELASQCLVIN